MKVKNITISRGISGLVMDEFEILFFFCKYTKRCKMAKSSTSYPSTCLDYFERGIESTKRLFRLLLERRASWLQVPLLPTRPQDIRFLVSDWGGGKFVYMVLVSQP